MLEETGNQAATTSGSFAGFVPPTRNYFMMPNEWTDITAGIDSLAELKVVEYVLRHTWGFHEFGICKTISIDEFMSGRKYTKGSRKGERMDRGTKLSRPSVIDGLRRAVEHGYLICTIDTTDQARITKSYALRMSDDVKMLNTSKETLPPDQSKAFTPPVKIPYQQSRLASKETLPRSEKETIEIHSKKERETTPPILPTPQRDSPSLPPRKSLSGETLVSHPTHSFVWFDDLVNPSVMVVKLTSAFPHPHFSEMEDKRRERIAAWEVLPALKKQGLEVEVRWEHESEQASIIVEAQTTKPAHPKMTLTDQEADFWTRWCAIAKSPELNETAYLHVVALAAEITSTADLQSLYDFKYDQLREFAKAKGKGEPLPPRLGNLIKALPEWKQTQVRRKQEKEQDQEAHEHIPGSGSITNWTQARLAGNQPAINYEPLPPIKKTSKDGLTKAGNVGNTLSSGLQERFRLAREKRQTETS